MKTLLITISLFFTFNTSWSQNGRWDVYMAQYENGPGSTILNMDLINSAPKKSLPYLVVTGVTTENCREDGFPQNDEFEKLHDVSDAVENKIQEVTTFEIVGTFTYQCERLDYVYVNDTTKIRQKLTEMYTSNFPEYEYYINIKIDEDWEAYLKFLYPNEETQEHMSNIKVVAKLAESGDNLEKARQVDHWLYFKDKKRRKLFTDAIIKEGFKIESQEKRIDLRLPYQLRISRTDYVSPNEINTLTLKLRKQAKEFNGEYDGWETFVVKPEGDL
ncbi:DUF695 domain-containing protein [Flammeovirga yaeyamensis]|uniref:DUF695 domain-containing protein n=1 Tax=Flammeovirga yaeyamensis TaxID=367791 RepID=A0AAX1NBR7_9BACT|nr:DUF695 domain-containing protein [Flammeovirga yaeyamensis]MBB3697048.1 hypothetical protein [Flammeovirga yaeyamensis]NMF33710.1 DUF695 domain-containing protein [Flammeovirga yaeyamensis]QWG05024.1 DUF695 domain-containing protein [Flammeovirga yaeyamensis]